MALAQPANVATAFVAMFWMYALAGGVSLAIASLIKAIAWGLARIERKPSDA